MKGLRQQLNSQTFTLSHLYHLFHLSHLSAQATHEVVAPVARKILLRLNSRSAPLPRPSSSNRNRTTTPPHTVAIGMVISVLIMDFAFPFVNKGDGEF